MLRRYYYLNNLTCLAPSAENVQPWRFIIIDNSNKIADFCKAAFGGIYRFSKFAENAAIIAVIAAQPDIFANKLGTRIQGTQYYLLDIGIAGEHFVLQAAEQGIGTCWIGWFNEKKARKHLALPRGQKVAALIALGYPLTFFIAKDFLKDLQIIYQESACPSSMKPQFDANKEYQLGAVGCGAMYLSVLMKELFSMIQDFFKLYDALC